MWLTPHGERILEGAEAKLFAGILLDLLKIAALNQLCDYHLDIESFDNLTYSQKISILETAGKGLLRKDVPTVNPTGVLEGAIAAIFEHLNNLIAMEINEPELSTNWRELVAAAIEETGAENIPTTTYNDLEEWIIEVESLVQNILWDVDYYKNYLFIKIPFDNSIYQNIAELSDNYCPTIDYELTKEEVEAKVDNLIKLCLLVTNVL
jgi:hypothetical protein